MQYISISKFDIFNFTSIMPRIIIFYGDRITQIFKSYPILFKCYDKIITNYFKNEIILSDIFSKLKDVITTIIIPRRTIIFYSILSITSIEDISIIVITTINSVIPNTSLNEIITITGINNIITCSTVNDIIATASIYSIISI